MSYQPKYQRFIFKDFGVDGSGHAYFEYEYEGGPSFREEIDFGVALPEVPAAALQAALFYVFILEGASYYKLWLAPEVLVDYPLDAEQADFFNYVYHGGLGELLYLNDLDHGVLARFEPNELPQPPLAEVAGEGVLLMQSAGKDSLLAAELLKAEVPSLTLWHQTNDGKHWEVIDKVGAPLVEVNRMVDYEALDAEQRAGGFKGHVPFSAMLAGTAMVSAILHGKQLVVAANEWSANEPTATLPDGTPVNHQFSKSYEFEQRFQEYLHRYISPQLDYGSLLRPFSELAINQLFVRLAWPQYSRHFTSCNRVMTRNYRKEHPDHQTRWCGDCPKCANTWLLLSPWVSFDELVEVFGSDLTKNQNLTQSFRQLLGIEQPKPFECVGEIEELQMAYHLGVERDERFALPGLDAPKGEYDYRELHPHQPLFDELVDYKKVIAT